VDGEKEGRAGREREKRGEMGRKGVDGRGEKERVGREERERERERELVKK
jgi:hypothetical protein